MRPLVLLALATACLGAGKVENNPAEVAVVVVQASNEQRETRYFDPKLGKAAADTLEKLKYDTFRCLSSTDIRLRPDETAKIPIGNQYVLHLTFLSRDDQGRLRVNACIKEKQVKQGKTVTRTALETQGALATGKPFVLGGLSMKSGDLAIVLTVNP